jgi:hypothetical protein
MTLSNKLSNNQPTPYRPWNASHLCNIFGTPELTWWTYPRIIQALSRFTSPRCFIPSNPNLKVHVVVKEAVHQTNIRIICRKEFSYPQEGLLQQCKIQLFIYPFPCVTGQMRSLMGSCRQIGILSKISEYLPKLLREDFSSLNSKFRTIFHNYSVTSGRLPQTL